VITWILAISFLAGAAVWGYWRHRRERDWSKAVLISLLCTWFLAGKIWPALLDARNPVYVALGLLSFTWSLTGRASVRGPVFHPALLTFLIVIAASVLWAINPRDVALRIAGLFLVFAFVWNLMRTTERTRIALLLADGLLYASYATIVLVALRNSLPESAALGDSLPEGWEAGQRMQFSEELKATGTATVCMWALVRLLAEGIVRRGNQRLLHLALAAVALAAMVWTGTRGTMIQFVLLAPLLAAISSPGTSSEGAIYRYALYTLALLAAGALLWHSLGTETKVAQLEKFRVGQGEGMLDTRLAPVWQPAMERARERPWLGRGLGSSSFYALTDEEYKELGSELSYRTTVHNQYLEVFYEFGLVGFAVFLWLLAALMLSAIRALRYQGPHAWLWHMLAIYGIVGILEGFTHGGQLSNGQLDVIRRWILYCLLLGSSFGWEPKHRRLRPVPRRGSRSKAKVERPMQVSRSNGTSGASPNGIEDRRGRDRMVQSRQGRMRGGSMA